MKMSRAVRLLGCGLCIGLVGCAGPGAVRIGDPVALPSGAPRTACEKQGWYELAPARVTETTARGGGYVTYYYSQQIEGYGVFKPGDDEPRALDLVWPKLHTPELQSSHEARIEPVDAARRRAMYWSGGGLVGLFAALGTGVAIREQSQTGAYVAVGTGLVLGLVGAIGGLIAQPSVEDELQANARRKLLIPGEDDMETAARAINAVNGERRLRCEEPAQGSLAPAAQGSR